MHLLLDESWTELAEYLYETASERGELPLADIFLRAIGHGLTQNYFDGCKIFSIDHLGDIGKMLIFGCKINECTERPVKREQFNFYGFLRATEVVRQFLNVVKLMGNATHNVEEEEEKAPNFNSKINSFWFWRNMVIDLLFDQWDVLHLSDDNVLAKWAIQELLHGYSNFFKSDGVIKQFYHTLLPFIN